MLVCCAVYRSELCRVEEEASRGESQGGVVTAQNLRITQLKAQVRQQAAGWVVQTPPPPLGSS